jgi:hypothetical protein
MKTNIVTEQEKQRMRELFAKSGKIQYVADATGRSRTAVREAIYGKTVKTNQLTEGVFNVDEREVWL